MKLQIDNLDGLGPVNYTSSVDGSRSPQIMRKLNQPSELHLSLVADSPTFVVPVAGARITLGLTNGQDVFTGYLMQSPVFEYLGWGERGPVYRYDLLAQSDEVLLDEKRLPDRCPFLDRSAGNALRQLTEDLLPGVFDTSAVQDLDMLAGYASNPRKTWSQQAAEIAIQARASYRFMNGALIFAPLGASSYPLNETDQAFCPEGLILQPVNALINDVTVDRKKRTASVCHGLLRWGWSDAEILSFSNAVYKNKHNSFRRRIYDFSARTYAVERDRSIKRSFGEWR